MKLRNKITKEICDAEMRENGIYIKANWSDEEKWFCYDLETLARGWEYYVEPKEPLIKDEKVRKAVRAWAEANGIGGCICKEEIHCITFETERGMFISFEDADPIPPEGNYTIDELCGEEEE